MRTRSLQGVGLAAATSWWVALAGVVGACGGASEQRIAALEAQLAELKQAQQAGPSDEAAALKTRVDTVEAQTQESIAKLQEVVQLLQGELAKGKEAPPSASLWQTLELILGLPAEPAVKVDGDTYTVRRTWLIEQARLVTAGGKLPRLAPDKKASGVVVRGVRPKSVFDALGLKNNDVIVAVGETATPTPEALAAALKAQSDSVTLKLLRKGKEMQLSYAIVE